MDIIELILVGVSLAMDAFAVSLCKGLTLKKMDYKKGAIVGLYFGFFQALMPLIGFLLGHNFENIIVRIDHFIVLFLLSLIGINMIIEAMNNKNNIDDKLDFKTMIVLALATSIDALAVGISLAFLNVNIWLAISIIGVCTFILSFIAVKIGFVFGNKYEKIAQIIGGIILILLGIKVLLEHLNIL